MTEAKGAAPQLGVGATPPLARSRATALGPATTTVVVSPRPTHQVSSGNQGPSPAADIPPDRTFGRIAGVAECQLEGLDHVTEDLDVFGPADDGARRHHRGEVAGGEPTRVIPATATMPPRASASRSAAGRDDADLGIGTQVVESGDDVPSIDLRLIQQLGAVVQPLRLPSPTVLAVAKIRNPGWADSTRF